MTELRGVLLRAGLTEAFKWRKPCYVHDGANISILQEMNDFLALMFFKGALMDDPKGVLREQGPNSRSARRMEFASVAEVKRQAATIRRYVREAIRVEQSGATVGTAPEPTLVDELQVRLDADPALRAAFEALTPGRRREYNLYFGDAKRASTRAGRVEKHVDRIRAGKGLRER